MTVRLDELHCQSFKPFEGDSLTLVTRLGVSANLEGAELSTISRYSVFAVDDEDADEPTPDNTVWRIDASFLAHWLLTSEDVTPHDAQCFAIGQGALTCHPYARETVQSVSARMNYAPATLDLIYNPFHGEDDGTEIFIEIPDDETSVESTQ
ncbi:hypothetical protein C6A86_011990 [Mycobacterium sp. ITM-2016-00316]|uniref:hypothetical protein n=1 Tax=Mycobacterium sp. ITM-2016-00316 TaxID=2099695 RepID=UPI000D483156|nr:hypothetical protein [Mycobacterium sp. ITM-2016-00316]WNG84302.1 hypothetical protein C6A86_011990 [Mycobacterium sp. ITM-2016-00316]